MDKEQKVAYEIIRQRIVEEIDRLEALDKPGSSLKRWRRFGAAFSWDPTVYPEILEKPTVSDKQLMSLLRQTEDKFMKKWGVIDKIPLHHIIANRTGGDLGLRLPVDVWEEVKERVFDATGARPGNGAANLNAASQFDERSHLGRPGAKGSVFDPELGYGDPADPSKSPILHGPGTKDFGTKLGKDPVVLQSSPAEIAEILKPQITKQQEIFEAVSKDPIVQQQRAVLTQAGYPEAFSPETSIERIQEINKEIRRTDVPKQFAKAFDFSRGAARFIPGVGLAAGLAAVGERAMAGDLQGAAGEGIAAVVGEVPIAGDALVMAAEGTAAGAGSDIIDPAQRQAYLKQREEQNKFDPLATAQSIMEMTNPISMGIKAARGAISLFGF